MGLDSLPQQTRADLTLYRWQFAGFEFDESRLTLQREDRLLELERKPLQVLAMLLHHAGEVVTKQELLDEIWAGRVTVEHVLATAIGKLRKVLGEAGERCIVTVPRVGYRFDAAVERVAVGRRRPSSSLHLTVGQTVPGRPHFRLERKIAQTHGSEVWLANHDKARQARVFKFAIDGERLYALKREVTVARLLAESLPERSDYVRILDWNFADEPYHLECEYGGPSLLDLASQDAGPTDWPREQRLALFLRIADAVAAAHSVGVLHKDIKPANVLIPPGPEQGSRVVLTDFGSSWLLEPERLAALGITGLGLTVSSGPDSDPDSGTPLYLAPEVIAGQASTVQSDVYALGVVLYQLLVGDFRRPMAPGWERDIDDELLCEDIAAATDGDCSRRFLSVSEFAECLRGLDQRRRDQDRSRHAAEQSRLARQALERLRARRPWLAATVAALVVGLLSTAWLYWSADQARIQAEQQTRRAEAINSFLNWEVLANTGNLTTGSDNQPTMHGMLRRVSQSVGAHFSEDPESEGWIRLAIGEGFAALNDHEAGEQEYRRALALLDQTLGEDAAKTLDTLYSMAANLLEQGRVNEGLRWLDEADARLRRVPSLQGSQKRSLSLRSRAFRGMAYLVQLRCDEALEQLRAAETLILHEKETNAFNLFNVRSWIGNSLNCLGRYDEARKHFEVLVESTREPDEEIGPVLPILARSGLSKAMHGAGQSDEALSLSDEVMNDLRQRLGEESVYTLMIERQQTEWKLMANAIDLAAAQLALQRIYSGLRTGVGEARGETARALRSLGIIEYQSNEFESAIAKLTQARTHLAAEFGDGSPDVQATDYYLCSLLLQTGRSVEAASLGQNLRAEALSLVLGGDGWPERVSDLQRQLASVRAGE